MLKNYEIGTIPIENKIMNQTMSKLSSPLKIRESWIKPSKTFENNMTTYSYDSEEAFNLLKNTNLLSKTINLQNPVS